MVSNSRGSENRKGYNCGETGHLMNACPKPSKEREYGGRGQTRGRGRGGRRGARGGYQANLMVAKEEEGTKVVFTEEDQALLEILRRKQRAADDTSFMSRGNTATYAYSATSTSNTNTLASTPEWIIDSGASRHVTGNASEFSSYTHLVMLGTLEAVSDEIMNLGI